jgi:hypothetical protein
VRLERISARRSRRPVAAARRAAHAALTAAALVLLAAAGCGCGEAPATGGTPSWAPQPDEPAGLRRLAFAEGERFVLQTAGGERSFIPGVNIGSTLPGSSPGELRIGADECRRWFAEIGALKLRAIRVYTIMPPHFYRELAEYNAAHVDAPLYLVQGVWIPEEEFLKTRNLYAPAVRDGFKRELREASAALHGDFTRSRRRGVAWGDWTADVSPWLLAYSIGVEWDATAIVASDRENAGRTPFAGRYFVASETASPTESWLAEMLETVAAAEAERGVTIPLTFTNWVTTDPLIHPDEPLGREDLVGIDANHVRPTADWSGGYFASYHAYPYYPDFQRYDTALADAGGGDPYAGYIAALRDHHAGLPLMITEFGVPSSTGLAHYGPLGRDQGGHTEQEAMAIDAELLHIIRERGCSGGFVFEWADEWFKFTWNTIDYELPADRRQLWRNPWTNEEHFGLVTMDAGERDVVTLDGDGSEWTTNGSQAIFEGRGPLREVRAVKDEAYLYLRLVLHDSGAWQSTPITLGFDVLPGRGGGLPGLGGKYAAADYAVVIGPGDKAEALVRASNDQYAILYGKVRGYVDYDPAALKSGSRAWNVQRLITNRPLTVPTTGEKLPAESVAVGALRRGATDPAGAAFDNGAAWYAGDVLELRLPWQSIGFSDPSSRRVLSVGPNGALTALRADGVELAVAVGASLHITRGYSWDPWQQATWHERPKAGRHLYAAAVADVQAE